MHILSIGREGFSWFFFVSRKCEGIYLAKCIWQKSLQLLPFWCAPCFLLNALPALYDSCNATGTLGILQLISKHLQCNGHLLVLVCCFSISLEWHDILFSEALSSRVDILYFWLENVSFYNKMKSVTLYGIWQILYWMRPRWTWGIPAVNHVGPHLKHPTVVIFPVHISISPALQILLFSLIWEIVVFMLFFQLNTKENFLFDVKVLCFISEGHLLSNFSPSLMNFCDELQSHGRLW